MQQVTSRKPFTVKKNTLSKNHIQPDARAYNVINWLVVWKASLGVEDIYVNATGYVMTNARKIVEVRIVAGGDRPRRRSCIGSSRRSCCHGWLRCNILGGSSGVGKQWRQILPES